MGGRLDKWWKGPERVGRTTVQLFTHHAVLCPPVPMQGGEAAKASCTPQLGRAPAHTGMPACLPAQLPACLLACTSTRLPSHLHTAHSHAWLQSPITHSLVF